MTYDELTYAALKIIFNFFLQLTHVSYLLHPLVCGRLVECPNTVLDIYNLHLQSNL